MGGGVGAGPIQEAHELGMTSAVRSTLAAPPVSPYGICLINGHQVKIRPGRAWLGIHGLRLWFKSFLGHDLKM